jgi:hypothetical protein
MSNLHTRKILLNLARHYNVMKEYWTIYKYLKEVYEHSDSDEFVNAMKPRLRAVIENKIKEENR